MRNLSKFNIDLSGMLDSILIFLGVIIPAFFSYRLGMKRHKAKMATQKKEFDIREAELLAQNCELNDQKAEADMKMSYYGQMFNPTSFNIISSAVDRIFDKTKADRFLIMIAVNGKTDFNIISVIFEQHKNKEYRINAIARYHNITIDPHYKQLLKNTNVQDVIELVTEDMPESILRDFFTDEKVKSSLVRQLVRTPMDSENDVLVYSSISTHSNKKFSRLEKSFIKTQYEGTIVPNFKKTIQN